MNFDETARLVVRTFLRPGARGLGLFIRTLLGYLEG